MSVVNRVYQSEDIMLGILKLKYFMKSPKYHVGDTVYVLEYSKIVERKIYGVLAKQYDKKPVYFTYYLELKNDTSTYGWLKEEDIFISRAQLIESL